MTLSYKHLVTRPVDVDGAGSGQLVFATLNVIDHDGDVTLAGFFGRQYVQLVPTHDWNHVPIGKALIYERGHEAIADFTLNLAIPAARDWYEAIKFDLDNPPSLQEYSYGFNIQPGGQRRGEFNGRPVRFLQPLGGGKAGCDVVEVSPVLRGAGLRTRTVQLAGAADTGLDDATRRELEDIAKSVADHATTSEALDEAFLTYLASAPWMNP